MTAASPEARLLDARQAGLDEPGLRAWARVECERTGAAHNCRSYRYPYALIAWHDEPVGIDIERVEPFDQAFLDSIRTPSEPSAVPGGTDGAEYLTSLWSGKEALSKALGDALAYDPRRLQAPLTWRDGRAGCWRARRLSVPAGHLAWMCWRSSAD